MRKLKKFLSKSLYIELAFGILFSFAIGIASYYSLEKVSESIANSRWAINAYKNHVLTKYSENLQTYIYENDISSKNTYLLDDWYTENVLFTFYLKKEDYIIYNSYILAGDYVSDEKISAYNDAFLNSLEEYMEIFPSVKTVTVHLTDCDATLYMYTDVSLILYYRLKIVAVCISALLIISIIIFFVRKKIHYINHIKEGINVLEGGNLDHNIPVSGEDELAQVAKSLNSMRVALAHQMDNEKKALRANNSLVTALSHDLRTPLTTQMGYLEILKEHHYNSPEEMDQYLTTALNTCHQIKEMSDRLFEYFLAFDPHPERPDEALEEIDGLPLFMQLFGELSLPLESQGFRFEIEEPDDSFMLHVNMDDVLRIFNNVFTNIDKYADESVPITVRFIRYDGFVIVAIKNKIRRVPRKNESAKIGLISISSLMKRQSGSSKTKVTGNTFTLELKFPTY